MVVVIKSCVATTGAVHFSVHSSLTGCALFIYEKCVTQKLLHTFNRSCRTHAAPLPFLCIFTSFYKKRQPKGRLLQDSINYSHFLKCSFVSVFTTPLRPTTPIKLGIAINPFMVSEMLQIKSRLPTAPIKTNATYTHR